MGDRATAVKFFNRAVACVNDKSKPSNPSTAFQLFASACEADPGWAHGWFQYAANCGGLDLRAAAIAAYRKSLHYENDKQEIINTYADMGFNLYTLGRIGEAIECLKKAVALDPKCYPAWINLSQSYGLRNDMAASLECARKAYEIAPDEDICEATIAFAYLFSRHLKEGFKHFEIRFKWRLHQFLQYPYPKWEGEDGKVVFLVADQGLGDTLCFARFVEKAAKKAKFIHAYVQPELMRLFMHAFIGIKNINLLPFGSSFPQADVWTTFVSLPFALGLEDNEIRNTPQIKPPLFHLPTTWMIPDQKLHVGIAWKGSKISDIDAHRTIPVHHFLELCRVPGVQLYSLQVGDGTEDANSIGAGALVKNLAPYIRDVCDTVALLQNLDLVIGCESAIGHICSMANKEFWMAYSYQGKDYRVGHDGTDILWAPKHRVFRQGEDRRWEPVFEDICVALEKRLKKYVPNKRHLVHA